MPTDLLSFDAALERLLSLALPLAPELLPFPDAAGRFLAADLSARLDQPSADLSAMDGYAIRFADLPGPFSLVGESAAGRPATCSVGPMEAVRIFTGAQVPQGADTVAVQEDAVADSGKVSFPHDGPPRAGAHIRRRGIDFENGQPVSRAGERLTAARMGLLLAAGHAEMPVHRRPHVAILSTGDELLPPGSLPPTGKIIASNAPMIAQLLRNHGAEVTDAGIAGDDLSALAGTIEQMKGADLIVTIGGASVGDHDLVRPALITAGATLDFWRIAIQPGKPLLAGQLGSSMVVGLPGNPVSAFVCARLFLVPLLRKMSGDPNPHDVALMARTAADLPPNGKRRQFLRAILSERSEGREVRSAERQDSSLLSVLAESNALLIREEHAPALKAGSSVPVLSL